MSNYSTREQRNAFTVGMGIMMLAHLGWDLCNLGGWTLFLGIPILIFTVIFVWAYTMEEKAKSQEDEV
tara:strand:- start:16070 stop:16273 length:204 start_codon:yes stop_codon:yes gene_type:complete